VHQKVSGRNGLRALPQFRRSRSGSGISDLALARLQHYFVLHHDMSDDQLENDLRRVWHDVQRLLLSTESCLNEPASVMISDCNVYAVFPDSKQIQKMTVEFTANCFVDNAQVDVGFEAGNLVIRFPGKNALAPRYAMDGLFHLTDLRSPFSSKSLA
jgi:hypothetical protein